MGRIIRKKARKITMSRALIYIFLSVTAIIYLYPLFWLTINSFKTNNEIYMSPWALPVKFIWENYITAWKTGKIGRYMFNSSIVTVFSLIIGVMLSSMAAFAIKRLKWKLSGFVLLLFLAGTMVPVHATLIPLFINFSAFNMTNRHISLILIYIVFSFPTTIFILSGFFGTIPRELEAAAVIDGCSIWRMFFSVIMPLAKPAIITVCIFNFIWMWNELLVSLIFISDINLMTLPVGLTNFSGQYTTNYPPMLAAVFLSVIPSIIIYSAFNSKIVAGITAGAIKG